MNSNAFVGSMPFLYGPAGEAAGAARAPWRSNRLPGATSPAMEEAEVYLRAAFGYRSGAAIADDVMWDEV